MLAGRASTFQPGQTAPRAVVLAGKAMLAYAAIGGPVDSLRSSEERLIRAINNTLNQSARPMLRLSTLNRAARIAFPGYVSRVYDSPDTSSSLVAAQSALLHHDYPGVRRQLAKIEQTRSAVRVADFTYDALLPEARLMVAVGDSLAAIRLLRRSLEALSATKAAQFVDDVAAGTFMQSMELYVVLLDKRAPTPEASRWRSAFGALRDPRSR